MAEASRSRQVVIIGGGFAGLFAARMLARAPVQVTLLDRAEHHLFQPLLYQCATGIMSEGKIARLVFGKMVTYANHLGPFSEEIDSTGGQLGNFPQAFSHLSLISAAVNLNRQLDHGPGMISAGRTTCRVTRSRSG